MVQIVWIHLIAYGDIHATGPCYWRHRREATASSWACCPQAARQELNFSIEHSLAERLRQTADWYRANGWLLPRRTPLALQPVSAESPAPCREVA